MWSFKSLLSSTLLVTTVVLATPVARSKGSQCDVSKDTMTLGTQSTLAAPTHTASFIGLGVGTQNYTCTGPNNTYASAGAVAELFDISCLYGSPAFNNIQDTAMSVWSKLPSSVSTSTIMDKLHLPGVLGQHYFVPNPANASLGLSPKWDFTSNSLKGNFNAFVIGAKVATLAAPTGKQDIDWLQLKAASGSLADEIYRVDTRSGQPPASCTAGSAPITVKYVSKYWLFGGSV